MSPELPQVIFGEAAKSYLPILDPIAKTVHGTTYEFLSIEKFTEAFEASSKKGIKIYWTELMYRSHLAATISILRHHRWIDGMLGAAAMHNFFIFAASFRGLIESMADSYEALKDVPLTIAENRKLISEALKGELEEFVVAEELENKLIHFSHGRKLPKGSTLPKAHRAKTSRDYLTILQGAEYGMIHKCYSELCEITHPASASVTFFLLPKNDEVYRLSNENDNVGIAVFCKKYRRIMPKIFQISFNTSLFTLRVINSLPLPKLRVPDLDEIKFDKIPAWKKLKKFL